jgi:bacterioferritin
MSNKELIINELITAYFNELETVQNYIANSQNLDGIYAEEIKKSLADDVSSEISHAQALADRIRTIGGRVPGSKEFKCSQPYLQPTSDSLDVLSVIKGVIEAEEVAIAQYTKIIKLCDGEDYGTQDLCIKLLSDEEHHLREFKGFLKEYEKSEKRKAV